jgi:hypothetical protein
MTGLRPSGKFNTVRCGCVVDNSATLWLFLEHVFVSPNPCVEVKNEY